MSSVMGINAGLSAFKAYGVRQDVAANNVANVNTNGYVPSRVDLEEAPSHNGVKVAQVRKETDQVNLSTREKQENKTEERNETYAQEMKEKPSGTDLAREFVSMLENKNAYGANAQAIKAQENMTGEVLNILA